MPILYPNYSVEDENTSGPKVYLENDNLTGFFYTTLKKVNSHFALGSGNKVSDYEKSNAWSYTAWKLTFGYSHFKKEIMSRQWGLIDRKSLYQLPYIIPTLNVDPILNLNPQEMELAIQAIVSKYVRTGNCLDKCKYLAHEIWKNCPENIFRIEVVVLKEFDHAFLILNRENNSEIDDFLSWNAYIIDPWRENGIVFHSNKYEIEMLKTLQFTMDQNIGLLFRTGKTSSFNGLFKYFINSFLNRIGIFDSINKFLFNLEFNFNFDSVIEIYPRERLYPVLDHLYQSYSVRRLINSSELLDNDKLKVFSLNEEGLTNNRNTSHCISDFYEISNSNYLPSLYTLRNIPFIANRDNDLNYKTSDEIKNELISYKIEHRKKFNDVLNELKFKKPFFKS